MNFALLFLIITLIFFGSVAYYFTIVRNQTAEEKKESLDLEKVREEEIVRDEKRIKDEVINAHQKAVAILTESEKVASELIADLEKSIGAKTTKEGLIIPGDSNFEMELGALSEKVKTHYVKRISDLLSSLNKFQVDQALKFEAFAQEQQVTTDKNLQLMRIDMLNQIRQKMERYKEEELSLFNKKVQMLIDQAAIEVIGHVLSSPEQDELITKALEKAKKEGVI